MMRSARISRTGYSALILAIGIIVACAATWLLVQEAMRASEYSAVARALTDGDATRAVPLMTRYGCAGCHTIPGIPGADGQVGGVLSDLRKRVFIAGVLPNNADNLVNWIVQPQRYAPHSAMPATGISQAEAHDVAAFLYSR